MACLGYAWDESIGLGKLAVPSVALNVLDMSIHICDLVFLGHFGREELAAGANAYFNMVWYFSEGMLTAQDSLTSYAFGMRDYAGARHWTYVSVMVMTCFALVGSVVLAFAPIVVRTVFALDGNLADEAVTYVLTLIPALWFQTGFRVIQKYLQAQSVMLPTIGCLAMGLLGNIIVNYILMFGLGLGSFGCAIGTSLVKGGMLAALFFYFTTREGFFAMRAEFLSTLTKESAFALTDQEEVETGNVQPSSGLRSKSASSGGNRGHGGGRGDVEMGALRTSVNSPDDTGGDDRPHSDNDDDDDDDDTVSLIKGEPVRTRGAGADASAEDKEEVGVGVGPWKSLVQRDCLRYVALGLPGGLVLIMELWSFDLAIIVASQIGEVSISAQQIVVTITSFLFVAVPLAFSIASTIRVSRLLGSQNHRAARTSSYLAVGISTVLMGICASVLYMLRSEVGYLFTSDVDVVNRVRLLVPVVASFQMVNGLQGAAQGVMRGMCRHTELFGYSLLAYWVIGFPLGIYLAFFTRPRNGLYGIWYGFLTGLGLLGFMLMFIIVTTNWEREVRRARVRAEKYHNSFETVQASPHPGSRALGGFLLLSPAGDEELDDVERIEITLYEEDVRRKS